MSIRSRDLHLIDAIDGRLGVAVDFPLWRVAREGRDPTECSANGGRWDDSTFDVLYTSEGREIALAEIEFHVRRGQPVIPSKVKFRLYKLKANLRNVLDLSSPGDLEDLGFNMDGFNRLSYTERLGEYPRTQEIAEVAHFHSYQGLIVPSARAAGRNVVIFCDQVDPGCVELDSDEGVIDWRK